MSFHFWIILSFITIGGITGDTFPDAIRGVILEAAKKCLTENNISPDILPQLKFSDFSKSDSLQKALLCGLTSTGFSDENGRFNLKKTAEFFPKDVQEVTEDCNKVDGKDLLDTAAKIFACLEEKSPVVYTFV